MRILAKTQTLVVFDLEKEECNGMTVADLKLKLESFPGIELTANEQCLRYDGIFLSDEMQLHDVFNERSDKFFLTRLQSNVTESEPNEEEGAVGGALTQQKNNSDKQSILTDSELKDLSLVPDLDFSTDEDIAAGVFDEDMELPPDLQHYFPTTVFSDEELVQKLSTMGYDERDARIALQASFNDPERAVEYLIEGIPKSLRSNLPELGDMGCSRTPPPSYSGSICSDCSTPPTPHSPVVSTNSLIAMPSCTHVDSGAVEIINTELFETTDGYDANDEAELLSGRLNKRKHKNVCKFKKRRIEIWAAKATIATAASNMAQPHTSIEAEEKIKSDLLNKLNFVNRNEAATVKMDVDELTGEMCSAEEPKTVAGDHHHENSETENLSALK